jgi:hypothetical protein
VISETTTAGTELEKIAVSETMVSNNVPRRHAAITPRNVPRLKLTSVATPTRPTVHIRARPRSSVTGNGKYLTERPRSPVNTLCI